MIDRLYLHKSLTFFISIMDNLERPEDSLIIERKKIVPPRTQAIALGGGAALMMLIATVVAKNPLTIWLISGSMLLLFPILNHIQSLAVRNYGQYLQKSLVAFVFTFIGLGGLSTILSGIPIFDAGHYRTIYIVILMTYFFFMGIIMLMKSFLMFLQKKDEKLR